MLSRRSLGGLARRACAQLAREEGQSLIFVAVSLVALLAVALLVIDGGRQFTQHTEVQNAADEVALAAARDLDDTSGICTSACQATLQTYAHANGIPASTTIVPCDAATTTNCYAAPYNGHVGQIRVKLTRPFTAYFGNVVASLLHGTLQPLEVSASSVASQRVVQTPATLSGNYIYAFQNVTMNTGAQVEEPLIAGGNIDLSKGNGDFVWPDARLVSAGGNIIGKHGAGMIGAGTGNAAEPQTTLSAAIGAADPAIPVVSTSAFAAAPGILKIDPDSGGLCTANPCEYVAYSAKSSTSFTASTRGYGGFGAPKATSHASGHTVDGRVAQLWVGGGCGAAPNGPFAFTNCQPAGAFANNLNIYAGPTINNCPYPTDPTQGCLSPPFAPPGADATAAYQTAAVGGANWGSTTCTGAAAPIFENNNTLDHSVKSAAQVLTPSTAYTCTGFAPDGSKGEIAWNPATSTLTAHGLIFIDGDFTITQALTYKTQADPNFNNNNVGATIWTSGTLQNLSNTSAICAVKGAIPGTCNATGGAWDPTTNVLGIVAAGTCAACGTHSINMNADFQGDIYTTGLLTNNSGHVEQGLIICQNLDMHAGTGNPVPEVTSLPGGFPGSTIVIDTSLVE